MYEDFYHLKGKPFQLNPDPSFFYASRGHKRAMAYLQYGLYQREGFIVITGDVGAGKTTLIRSLLEQLDPKEFMAAQLVSTQLDADQILRAVAIAFELPTAATDKARLLADLEKYLTSLKAENKRALLIVDEAQNLTPRAVEELRMLSNFQVGETALLQSFLLGQPELRQVMRSPEMQQLRQRVIASYHLGPMDRAETEAYIKHRLSHVGWTGDPAFDVSTFDGIYAYTQGIPRRINTFCNRLMLAGYLLESHALTGTDVGAVVEEMKEEIGDDEAADGHHPVHLVPRPAASFGREELAAQQGLAGTQSITTIAGDAHMEPNLTAGGHDDPAQLEHRVVRLEKAMAAALDILHRLLKVEPVRQKDVESEAR